MNKTTQTITFCIMGLICLSSMIYSFIKADEAQKSRMEAEAQRSEAVRLIKKLEALQIDAEAAAKEARIQAARAEEALTNCN